MKIQTLNPLEKYLFDSNISDEIYITINKDKIGINCDNFIDYSADVVEIEYSKYCIAVYSLGKSTILTILEGEETLYGPEYELKTNSQFLINKDNLSEDLEINDLAKYVSTEVADIVLTFCS